MIEITKYREPTIKENIGRIILNESFDSMIIQGQIISIEKYDETALKSIILKYIPNIEGYVEHKEIAVTAEAIAEELIEPIVKP